MKNILLLLIMLLATCSYAGSFGVSPNSNSPNEKKTATQRSTTTKHKTTKHFFRFKAHKRKHKHILNEVPSNSTRENKGFLDWYNDLPSFWMHLPMILLVLVLAGLGVAGILIPILWLWILGFSLYLGLIITIFVLMEQERLEEEFGFYFIIALITSILAALMTIGISLGIIGLWLPMAILLLLFLLASTGIVLILSNVSRR